MKLLEDRIKRDGEVLDGDVLKINSFLNHQVDPKLMMQVGEEFKRLFADEKIDKVVMTVVRSHHTNVPKPMQVNLDPKTMLISK